MCDIRCSVEQIDQFVIDVNKAVPLGPELSFLLQFKLLALLLPFLHQLLNLLPFDFFIAVEFRHWDFKWHRQATLLLDYPVHCQFCSF
mmetsp:Transcript_24236/g.30040  ORF Transcript_24236/g.30040 Transcript_24236/m.30040 type:complete len:88 (+) Transcript_24236:1102-1365(+)